MVAAAHKYQPLANVFDDELQLPSTGLHMHSHVLRLEETGIGS